MSSISDKLVELARLKSDDEDVLLTTASRVLEAMLLLALLIRIEDELDARMLEEDMAIDVTASSGDNRIAPTLWLSATTNVVRPPESPLK